MFSTFGAPIRETFANPISTNKLKTNKLNSGEYIYNNNNEQITFFTSKSKDSGIETIHYRKNDDNQTRTCVDCVVTENNQQIKFPPSLLNKNDSEESEEPESTSVVDENDSEEVAFSESESDSSDESDSDPEEEESKNEEGNYFSSSSNTTTKTTSVKNNEEETDSEESEEPESTSVVDENDEDKDESEEEGNTDGEDEDESNVPVPTTGEGFYGGSNVEHFSNKNGFTMSSVFSINLLLKSVMIACLFYVLAHPDTKKYILGRVFKNIKPENYLYVAMLLFLVIFYVIGIFL